MKAKPLIAILLAGLIGVITGHNIVPHHHHNDDIHTHAGCENHDASEHSGNHAGESGDPAQHCHAFNGLQYVYEFEKRVEIKPIAKSTSICLIPVIFRFKPLPRKVNHDWSGLPPPLLTGFLGESAGLRAPPSNS